MNIQNIISDTKYPKRTQISLSVSLYQLIKHIATIKEKSLSHLVRESLYQYLKDEEKRRSMDKEKLWLLANAPWRELKNEKSGWRKVHSARKLIRIWRAKE